MPSLAKLSNDQQGRMRRTSSSVLLLLHAEENMRASMESESCKRTQVWSRHSCMLCSEAAFRHSFSDSCRSDYSNAPSAATVNS